MKTRQEVDELKKQWIADPWDCLGSTAGFEEHRAELDAFETAWSIKREQERRQKLLDLAAQYGICDSMKLASILKTTLDRLELAEQRIQELQGQVWALENPKR